MRKNGFTLIELLVVISIIAILISIGTINFLDLRKRGRDAQRKADLAKIASALEQYRNDHIYFPIADANITSTPCSPYNYDVCPSPNQGKFIGTSDTGKTITYLAPMPSDPSGSTYFNRGVYYYTSNQDDYKLVACLENANDKDKSSEPTNFKGASINTAAIVTITCSSGAYYILTNPK